MLISRRGWFAAALLGLCIQFSIVHGQAPTFVQDCPEDRFVAPDQNGEAEASWSDLEAINNSTGEEVEVTCDPESGSTFNETETMVTCTATDTGTNETANCTFMVTLSPTFSRSCPADIIIAGNEMEEATVSWLQPTGNYDSTGQPAVVQCSPRSGSIFNETETIVTCTATDAGTNGTINCTFRVIVDSEKPTLDCPEDTIMVEADPGTNNATANWTLPAVPDDDGDVTRPVEVKCIPESGSVFRYGSTLVVCSAVDSVDNIGQCSFNVEVTGPPCEPECPNNSTCMLPASGIPTCMCDKGYYNEGGNCTSLDECQDASPCHSDATCTDLEPPEFFRCACNSGFYGDGIYSCKRYIPPEYPDIPVTEGSADLEKRFLVVIVIDTLSAAGCNPVTDDDKMSVDCLALVNTVKGLVSPVYRQVSLDGFKDVTVNQTKIEKGSVIIPHIVSYNYSVVTVRDIQAAEFYALSLQPDVEAGRLGGLELSPYDCTGCTTVTEITNVCENIDWGAVRCSEGRAPKMERDANTGRCLVKCVSDCEYRSDYCNGGTCSQAPGQAAECSDCPEDTEGPRCKEKGEPNIPLIVGLSVGLGVPVLLFIIGVIAYAVYSTREKKLTIEGGGGQRGAQGHENVGMDSYKGTSEYS